jgi:PAS domain S-box-containing protein
MDQSKPPVPDEGGRSELRCAVLDDGIGCGLFEHAAEGIFQTSPDGKYLAANPALARIYGFASPADLIASLTDIGNQLYVDPGRRGDFARALRDHGEVHAFESKVRRRDGRIIWITETARAVSDSAGRPVYYEGFVEDITARKEAEARLRLANETLERRVAERTAELEEAKRAAEEATVAKSKVLASMSHELRTPLNAILGFTELMRRELYGPVGHDKYREYLGDVHRSAQLLLALIDDVLDLSKIEAGKLELDIRPVAVADLLEDALRMVRERAIRGGCVLVLEVSPDLPAVSCDGRRTLQVVLNLLSNAVKFTPRGGRIAVSAGPAPGRPGMLVMRVEDTGIGMRPEDIPRALSEFGQVANGKARNRDGTGLGLPLARRLVEMQGGSFRLSSVPGHGTTAEVELPMAGS